MPAGCPGSSCCRSRIRIVHSTRSHPTRRTDRFLMMENPIMVWLSNISLFLGVRPSETDGLGKTTPTTVAKLLFCNHVDSLALYPYFSPAWALNIINVGFNSLRIIHFKMGGKTRSPGIARFVSQEHIEQFWFWFYKKDVNIRTLMRCLFIYLPHTQPWSEQAQQWWRCHLGWRPPSSDGQGSWVGCCPLCRQGQKEIGITWLG